MAKVKYDVSGVESSDFTPVKPGMYRAKIEEVNDWKGQHGPGLEIVLTVVSDSKGKKKDVDGIGSKLWTYIYLDYEPTAWKLAEFVKALGGKAKGTLDTDKLVGTELQVRVKPDRNDDGEYRPRVGKLLALSAEADDDEEEDEPEEPEEGDDDAVDLDELDRAALKKLIKDEGLEISIKKSMSEDDIRKLIADAMGGDEEEEEPEDDEEEDDDDEGVDLSELDRKALKAFIKENDLDVTVKKSMSEDDIREAIAAAAESDDDEEDDDDEEEGDDAAPDYSEWDATKLKAELKERGLKLSGGFTKAKAVSALKKDDDSDDEPF